MRGFQSRFSFVPFVRSASVEKSRFRRISCAISSRARFSPSAPPTLPPRSVKYLIACLFREVPGLGELGRGGRELLPLVFDPLRLLKIVVTSSFSYCLRSAATAPSGDASCSYYWRAGLFTSSLGVIPRRGLTACALQTTSGFLSFRGAL